MVDHTQPEQVGLRYLSVADRVRKVLNEQMTTSGLSMARTKVLRVLERNTWIRQTSLAQELGFAQRSVTQAIEGLERDGLVERTSDPTDGRAKLVTLTADGAAALAASTAAGNRGLQQIFGSLDRQQLAQLDTLLTTIDAAAAAT